MFVPMTSSIVEVTMCGTPSSAPTRASMRTLLTVVVCGWLRIQPTVMSWWSIRRMAALSVVNIGLLMAFSSWRVCASLGSCYSTLSRL